MPAVRGGWRRGLRPDQREYLPLTSQVITEHLSGDAEIGLYPMLDGDRCQWLAADFDGAAAMLDALAYVKAARAADVPTALEVSRSRAGAHVWLFFTSPVPAVTARQIGTGLLRETMALRGRMSLSSYDRAVPDPGRAADRRARQSDRRPDVRQGTPPRHHGVSGSGELGAPR